MPAGRAAATLDSPGVATAGGQDGRGGMGDITRSESTARADGAAAPAGDVIGRLAAGAFVVGGLASLVPAVWLPTSALGGMDEPTYADISGAGGGWLVWHQLNALGVTLAMVGLSLMVCLLVRDRGRRWAASGAAVTTVGGVLFAPGVAAFGYLGAYATESDALSRAEGTKLVEYVNDHAGDVLILLIPGVILITAGQLLLAVALWRGGTVPVWYVGAMAVLNLVSFFVPGRVSGWCVAVLIVLYGWLVRLVWTGARAPA
ncbi:hypothetical protein AB0M28_38990 [Streptomyces sp. NPDC051940]|uniref:hypothetical protein n=1 Tax=Streptomyces sp. NPDC051940 TaxID=3155675 RepID=UPI00343B0AC4